LIFGKKKKGKRIHDPKTISTTSLVLMGKLKVNGTTRARKRRSGSELGF